MIISFSVYAQGARENNQIQDRKMQKLDKEGYNELVEATSWLLRVSPIELNERLNEINYSMELWNDINSIDDFIGKWEGYEIVPIPGNEEHFRPESSIKVSVSIGYIKGSKEVNCNMEVDLTRLVTDWSNVEKMKEAGITEDGLWEILAERFENKPLIIGRRVNYDFSENSDIFLSNSSIISYFFLFVNFFNDFFEILYFIDRHYLICN
jgi:hypothetical protein